jgi:hypothetical protein
VRSGTRLWLGGGVVSREDYQRAMADLMRSPGSCQAVGSGSAEALEGYVLTPVERQRLRSVARHRGMVVNCTLYRASRLVGITRRLPLTVQLLGPALREVFDAYLLEYPDADAEFDREARSFARFVASRLDTPSDRHAIPTGPWRATLAVETHGLCD